MPSKTQSEALPASIPDTILSVIRIAVQAPATLRPISPDITCLVPLRDTYSRPITGLAAAIGVAWVVDAHLRSGALRRRVAHTEAAAIGVLVFESARAGAHGTPRAAARVRFTVAVVGTRSRTTAAAGRVRVFEVLGGDEARKESR